MNDHPIQVVATPDDYKRSRLTTFFRPILVIPHIIWLYVILVGAVVGILVGFIWGLITGTIPVWAHRVIRFMLIYQTRIGAYMGLMADPWPSFGISAPYPVDLGIPAAPTKMKRWGIFFRILLIYPALILSAGMGFASQIGSLFAWVTGVILGRVPVGVMRFNLAALQYQAQVNANANFLTSRYPSWAPVDYTGSATS